MPAVRLSGLQRDKYRRSDLVNIQKRTFGNGTTVDDDTLSKVDEARSVVTLTPKRINEAFASVKDNFTIDGGKISMISEDRFGEARDLIRDFFLPDEPLSMAFSVDWNPDFDDIVVNVLKERLSVMAVSEDTNEIMAVLLNCVAKRSVAMDISSLRDESMRQLFTFLYSKDLTKELYDAHGVVEAMYFFMLCVSDKYRTKGLGNTLTAVCTAMAKELGFRAIKGEGTSNYSQRSIEKQGFETVAEMRYEDYIYKGHPLRDRTGVHTSQKIYIKTL